MEMAHRLTQTPGKCENIHGHSWWATLEIGGNVDENGLLGGLDFGTVKSHFRTYLDTHYDHKLILNANDYLAVRQEEPALPTGKSRLPGLHTVPVDPTTENLAKIIGQWCRETFGLQFQYRLILWETSVNCATWEG